MKKAGLTVRYEAVNAMLLNEFLKEHRKVEAQAAINERQEATIARLVAALAKMQTTMEKVSARVETGASSTRLVSADE